MTSNAATTRANRIAMVPPGVSSTSASPGLPHVSRNDARAQRASLTPDRLQPPQPRAEPLEHRQPELARLLARRAVVHRRDPESPRREALAVADEGVDRRHHERD